MDDVSANVLQCTCYQDGRQVLNSIKGMLHVTGGHSELLMHSMKDSGIVCMM
jgi:hypothetical protein